MDKSHNSSPVDRVSRRSYSLRAFWLLVGFLALGIGIIGIVVPLLPTTPLVLLAAFAFGKSSPALRNRLLANRVFGPMIRDWEAHGAIAWQFKLMAVGAMITVFGISWFMGLRPMVLIIQGICLTLAGIYVVSRPSGRV